MENEKNLIEAETEGLVEKLNDSLEELSNELGEEDAEQAIQEVIEELKEELTDEEKKEIYIEQLKASIYRHHPIKHKGNTTTNRFGTSDKKNRQKRNKLRKKANQRNRK